MRTNSSRQVVGVEIVLETAGKPLLVAFAVGIRVRSALPTAVGATASLANLAPVAGFTGQSGKLVWSITPGVGEQRSLKFPVRSAFEGTFWKIEFGFFSRRHSSEKKKKVFFLSAL